MNPIALPTGYTRNCTDPWTYLEIFVNQTVRPCCVLRPFAKMTPDSDQDVREHPFAVELRKNLLEGNLNISCQRCHIRKAVPVEKFKETISQLQRQTSTQDLSAPLPLTQLRVDLSTNCNLRCDYCGVSNPNFKGHDMPSSLFPVVLRAVSQMPSGSTISVNGHGETTFHPQWAEFCQAIIDLGHRPEITTNLGLHYSQEEIDLLARFRTVQISLDSTDETMMRSIRKAVKISHVFENIQRIKDAGKIQGIKRPAAITFSVGIYDPAVWNLVESVDTLIKQGAQGFTFWNLVELPHQKQVTHIKRLGGNSHAEIRHILSQVRERLETAKLPYDFAGDFLDSAGNSLL